MKLVPLTQGRFAKVSDRDFGEVSRFKWCLAAPGRKIVGRFMQVAVATESEDSGSTSEDYRKIHARAFTMQKVLDLVTQN